MANPKTLSTLEIARELGMTRVGVLRWVLQGKLRARRRPDNGTWRVSREALDDFIRRWALTARGAKKLAARAARIAASELVVESMGYKAPDVMSPDLGTDE